MVEHDGPNGPPSRPKSGALQQYRLFFLEGIDTLISYSHEFEAEDDDQAVRISEAWREGRRAELWCGAQKVKSWEHSRER